MNNQNFNNQYVTQDEQKQDDEKWYESLWGLVLLSVGLNIFSNWIYDKGRERIRKQDEARERRRNRRHLMDYHDKTKEEAKQAEEISNMQSYDVNE